MKVYIGYDQREQEAYRVAVSSLLKHASVPVEIVKLDAERLEQNGLLRRPQDRRGGIYDIPSNANCSTDFAISRFMVPLLAHEGFALFVDCDVVFLADVAELFEQADPDKAVMVVKHKPLNETGTKMDGQQQLMYYRKNWTSVCIFNCNHPANKRLSLQDINERPGRDLHSFYWLNDSEIGSLTCDWNVLVNVQEMPIMPKLLHFTQGGPWLPTWQGAEHDEIWLEASRG